MLKRLIKLAIAALVVHASWRGGEAFVQNYQFRDAVHEAVLFSGSSTDSQIRARVLELARQFDVPLLEENLTVRREENRTIVSAPYTRQIELIPTKFYPWEFKVREEAFNASMPRYGDVAAPGR